MMLSENHLHILSKRIAVSMRGLHLISMELVRAMYLRTTVHVSNNSLAMIIRILR